MPKGNNKQTWFARLPLELDKLAVVSVEVTAFSDDFFFHGQLLLSIADYTATWKAMLLSHTFNQHSDRGQEKWEKNVGHNKK